MIAGADPKTTSLTPDDFEADNIRTSPNDVTRDRSRQEVGIVVGPLAHRQAVSSLQDKDLTPDG